MRLSKSGFNLRLMAIEKVKILMNFEKSRWLLSCWHLTKQDRNLRITVSLFEKIVVIQTFSVHEFKVVIIKSLSVYGVS